jgi:predicted dehydrogenase
MLAVQKAVFDGEIGDVRCVYSDLSMDAFGKRPDSHRVLSAELAGGALLDLGPYPMLWVSVLVA